MNTRSQINTILTYCIAGVWLINGLFCKVLNLVPRHQEIISEILGASYARSLTIAIGLSECLMAFWILSRYFSRICSMTQIILIAVMNIMEYFLVPDLLLWGKWNSFYAFLFIILIAANEFYFKSKTQS